MYCCLIRITFLHQYLSVKDEHFLHCWTELLQLLESNAFTVHSVQGNYAYLYQEINDFINQRRVALTLRRVTEYMQQNILLFGGYNMIFGICEADAVSHDVLKFRNMLLCTPHNECLWFTSSSAQKFSAHIRFRPAGTVCEYIGPIQDGNVSLFSLFVSTPFHLALVQEKLKLGGRKHNYRRMILFLAHEHSGMNEVIRAVLTGKKQVPCFPKLKDVGIEESMRIFFSGCNAHSLKQYATSDQEFMVLLKGIQCICNVQTVSPLLWRTIRHTLPLFFRLYLRKQQKKYETPFIFIENVDLWPNSDLGFLDSMLELGDPNRAITVIGSAPASYKLEDRPWRISNQPLDLRQYDPTVLTATHNSHRRDSVPAEMPEAFDAFSELMSIQNKTKTTSPHLRPLSSLHCEILYVLRFITPYHATVDHIIAIMLKCKYQMHAVHESLLFLVHHGYLQDMSTLYFNRSTETLFHDGTLSATLQKKNTLENIAIHYYARLHEQGAIALPESFLKHSLQYLSFEQWLKNVFWYCERIMAMEGECSYLNSEHFIRQIKNAKRKRKPMMKPLLFLLYARINMYTRQFLRLQSCIEVLQKIQNMPDYLNIIWLEVQSQYHLLTNMAVDVPTKQILIHKNDIARHYSSTAYCILGFSAIKKERKAIGLRYLHFAMESIEPERALYATMFIYVASCCSFFVYGHFQDVRTSAEKALVFCREYSNNLWQCYYMIILARLKFQLGHYHDAQNIFQAISTLAERCQFTTVAQIGKSWEARSLGYRGDWNAARELLQKCTDSLERNFFLAESLFFCEEFQDAQQILEEISTSTLPEQSTVFSAPVQWSNAWDPLEHFFHCSSMQNFALINIIRSFHALVLCRQGKLERAQGLSESIIRSASKLSSEDPNFPFYYQIYAEILMAFNQTHSVHFREYQGALSQAVRIVKERSSNIENSTERKDFLSRNYWNKLLFLRAKEENIAD